MDRVEIDLNSVKAIVKIEIDPEEAFRMLCKSLAMECVLESEDKYFHTKTNEDDELGVWLDDELYDDRGELYEALYYVAECIFPGVPRRYRR